jgi:hypothetical protein
MIREANHESGFARRMRTHDVFNVLYTDFIPNKTFWSGFDQRTICRVFSYFQEYPKDDDDDDPSKARMSWWLRHHDDNVGSAHTSSGLRPDDRFFPNSNLVLEYNSFIKNIAHTNKCSQFIINSIFDANDKRSYHSKCKHFIKKIHFEYFQERTNLWRWCFNYENVSFKKNDCPI